MFGRNFFGAPSRWGGGGPRLGAIVPIARPRKKMGQLSCCNAPDGKGYCFDTGSGECIMTWVSSATGTPGTPACVRDSRGQWVLPSCVGQEAVESGGRPPLPVGCEYVGAASNAIQEVICECYNCTTRQSDGWRGELSAFIAMGSKNPCLKTPEWFPKPAQCPNGPGGGGSYTPPTPGPTPTPTAGTPPSPAPLLPDQSGLTSANRSFCGPSGGPFTIVEVDPVSGDPIRIVARDIPFADPNYEWTGRESNPSWCAEFLGSEASPKVPELPPTDAPAPTAMPTPGYYPPTPGGAVPVMPGPFQGPPPASQVRMAPAQSAAQRFNQSMRPACRSTPYKTHMFPAATVPLRPDAFSPASQWVR